MINNPENILGHYQEEINNEDSFDNFNEKLEQQSCLLEEIRLTKESLEQTKTILQQSQAALRLERAGAEYREEPPRSQRDIERMLGNVRE